MPRESMRRQTGADPGIVCPSLSAADQGVQYLTKRVLTPHTMLERRQPGRDDFLVLSGLDDISPTWELAAHVRTDVASPPRLTAPALCICNFLRRVLSRRCLLGAHPVTAQASQHWPQASVLVVPHWRHGSVFLEWDTLGVWDRVVDFVCTGKHADALPPELWHREAC